MCIENKNGIPKIIHYCWFGDNEPSETMKYYIGTWRKHLSGYEIKEWNDENIKDIKSPYLEIAIKNKMWAFVADYVRFWALYNYGGIYLDTDVEVFKSFDKLLNRGFFIGLEMYSSGISLGTATIGASKKLPMLKEIIEMYDNHNPIRKNGYFDYFSTSPKMLVKFFKEKYGYNFEKFIYNKNITEFAPNCFVFPEIYFSAHKYSITEYTYCKHNFSKNWGIDWQVKTPINLKKFKLHILKQHKKTKMLPLLETEELLLFLKITKVKSIAWVKCNK